MATTTTVNDVYQNGHLAYQTDGSGTLLATFTYDDNGMPTSVQVGSNPQTAPRYYYVYNGHGDVVNLADASGNIVASYTYDEFGAPLSSSESFPGGWTNPYRYDGRDLVRYDSETSLDWMSVRAYDPTLGRFIARDPLGRAPLMGWTSQPYAYAGNNPLVNVDPSGQRFFSEGMTVAQQVQSVHQTQHVARIHRIVPHFYGCKGTMAQCSRWKNEIAYWRTEQGQTIGILQMGIGAIDMAQGLYGLFEHVTGKKHLSVLDKVGKFLDIIGGFVSILGGLSTYLSSKGVDTSFLDVVTNTLGAAVSGVAALYHLVKKGLGWLFEGGLSAAWSIVTYMFTSFNLAGVITLLVSLVFHATFEDGLEFARDALTAWLDWRQRGVALAGVDTVDQFYQSNHGVCTGY